MSSPTDLAAPSRRQIGAVLVGSGTIGFLLGSFCYPTWHDAIEPAQVVAGLVHYPPGNPVYVYSVKTWTVLHQILAVLLTIGLSERTLAFGLSGTTGMLSFQALGLVVLAFSRDVGMSILAPVFILVTYATAGGVTYTVSLMGVANTYGVIGLSYLLLAFALAGTGQVRWSALMFGFGPAVHPVIGVSGIAIAVVAAGLDRTWLRSHAACAWRWFLAGVAAAGVCALVHNLLTDPVPPARYAASFLQHWDWHRQPFPLLSGRALATYFSALVPALCLWKLRHEVPDHTRLLLRMLVVTAVAGGAMSTSYWIVPPDVPNLIAALMPSRLLNLNVLTCMALIIGVAGHYRHNVGIQTTLAALVIGLLALSQWARMNGDNRARFVIPWVAMGVAAAILAVLVSRGQHGPDMAGARAWWLRRLRHATVAATGVAFAAIVTFAATGRSVVRQQFLDSMNDRVLAAASRKDGLLLTSSDMHDVQLRTRRAVLLNGGSLNTLPYVPEAEAETDRILERVYGIDLRTVQAMHAGSLEREDGRALWERRTPYEWQEIAREFGVTGILTHAGWTLQLPVVAESAELTLYEIPRHP
jgi:MFS family permease